MDEEIKPSAITEFDSMLAPYRSEFNGIPGFLAGLPTYARNFSRDTLFAGLITGNADLIHSQLLISASLQGQSSDPITGEEKGKIHHEYPGVELRAPYYTTYNACDTTSLFLISIDALSRVDYAKYREFVDTHKENIETAVHYLRSHIVDGLFWERPPLGATQFSLRMTTWKDSVPPNRAVEEPSYPATFALVQFQAALGMEAAATILVDQDLMDLADELFRTGINKFIKEEQFCVMEDACAELDLNTSDELHSLTYIPVRYKDLLPLDAIIRRARDLITPIGIACTPKDAAAVLDDRYHGYVVWPFEQALIHQGCLKFGLDELAEVATRVADHIGEGQELFELDPKFAASGNGQQLWSVAASEYFTHGTSLGSGSILNR